MKWTQIVRLQFEIVLVDGGAVRGSGGGLEIGSAVDANLAVLRNPANDEPYLPGSSLKGKLRSTLEKEYGLGRDGKPCDCGNRDCQVCPIFGAHKPNAECAPTRIVVRDAHFTPGYRDEYEKRLQEGRPVLEEKTENLVNRKSGAAKDPHTGERVLPGARFAAEIILHIYEGDEAADMERSIRHALAVVQEASSIGAGGSRGSGRVRFENLSSSAIPLASLQI
jgi:CRISPR-associated protein Csm3